MHYKLPITINPLEYGKLIYNKLNLFIIYLNKTNIAVIHKHDLYNHIQIFKNGELRFEYNDHIINDSTFVRSVKNRKFTFKNHELISIENLKSIIRTF